jgi:glycosyltransferase involved in cell wall biosynthesis
MIPVFSICIPNYNYEKYLGITLESIFNQTLTHFEVVVADNCSTDQSVAIVQRYREKYPNQVFYKINSTNLGFAGNLDQAASLAKGAYLIMLSSDDTMRPEALSIYSTLITHLGPDKKIILSAANDVIDSEGKIIRSPRAQDFRFNVWKPEDEDTELSALTGVPVYRVAAQEMLRRSLLHCTNPFNFLATAYSKTLYEEVGGYGGGRLINPDKWFHWKIMAQADDVIFVDSPLFEYRWHTQNQSAQQASSGFLKYLVDEYRNTMEVTAAMLSRAGMTNLEFIQAFISTDIFRHGMGEFTKGGWLKSFRIYFFGLSTYPGRMLRHRYFIIYTLALATTPIGAYLVSIFKRLRK